MEGPRSCLPGERLAAIELIDRVFRVSMGFPPSMGREFPSLLGEGNLENMLVFSEGGRIASVLSFYPSRLLVEGCVIDAASVGAVCTDPAFEGRGLSTALLGEALRRMRERGVDLLLVSGERGLYLRAGCAKAGSYDRFKLAGCDARRPRGSEARAREGGEGDLDELARIYRGESTRFLRSREEFGRLWRGATTNWGRREYRTLVVERGGAAVGYFVACVARERELSARVAEYAGDRQALLDAMLDFARAEGLPSLALQVPRGDPLGAAAREAGLEGEAVAAHGTLKLLRFPETMEKLRPLLAERAGESAARSASFEAIGERYAIEVAGDRLEIEGDAALAQAALGRPASAGITGPAAGSGLAGALAGLAFPISIPWPWGLNYQ